MAKKSLLTIVLTGFFLLISCAGRQNLKEPLDSWMYLDHTKLIAKWGAPDKSYETEKMGCEIGLAYRDYDDIIVVDSLSPNMPAKKMGIRVNDVITHINNRSIKTMTESEIKAAITGGNPLLAIMMEGKNSDISTEISDVSTEVKVPCVPEKTKMKFLTYARTQYSRTSYSDYSSTTVASSCSITFKINHAGMIVGWSSNNC